ncbi:DNA polymerase I [Blastochloris viridis]|uniref:DNA polymerase I n=1 Tax=Blastochloris viridis TaxID=1079 RepID=A0A0H5BGN5_BLAVI|nr:DNA polymerase I [Blastochloris viridis]ALK10514.1 DNA polymerase I [Blastochloris viridis]BAR99536.1 DNA polymerase I [Blastochloris viridis]CUU43176.1 DNA polymerase I [Blastochloris viridis]
MLDASALKPGDHLFLVDGSSFVFRAYFQSMNQDRKYNTRSDGLPTGAVRLFCTKIFQFVKDGALGIKPSHLAIIFDKSEKSFRKEIYPAYKAHRPDPPAELVPQFPLMRKAVAAFGLEPIELEGFEADDLIASYAREAAAAGAKVLIVSSDKDLMQLVDGLVAFYDPESGLKGKPGYRPERLLHAAEVTERWEGTPPEKIADVQALAGDATDNVPGAPGIGIKTAAQLIAEYGDLETLLARAHEIKQPKRRATLTDPEIVERIRISKRLVTLDVHAPLPVPIERLTLVAPEPRPLIGFLKALDLTALTKRAGEIYEVDPALVDPDPDLAPGGETSDRLLALIGAGPEAADERGEVTASAGSAIATAKPAARPAQPRELTPAALATARAAAIKAVPFEPSRCETVADLAALDGWIARIIDLGTVALAAALSGHDPMRAELVGLALAVEPGQACYIPLGHVSGEGLFGDGRVAGQLAAAEVVERLRLIMTDQSIRKIGHDIKGLSVVLGRVGLDCTALDDVMTASYVLDAGRASHDLPALARHWLGVEPKSRQDITGSGKAALPMVRVAIDDAKAYAAGEADVALRLWRVLEPRLIAEGMASVYARLERPLLPVLAQMEARGIAIDRQVLARLSGEFAHKAAALEAEIHRLAGESFNIGSPKQIGDILFGKMGLPGASKTPTGAWSTKATILDDLAEQGFDLPARILDWRQLTKLKSTYTDALPSFVNPATGRVHTSFALAATTTGRLSSSEPNLQNIPVRTEDGRKIRKAFVAAEGCKLVSADYSQIELRLLAHVADIPQLIQAFADGIDIHALTASEMFGVPVAGMPPEVRRRAKAINFGIIYGISAFGLANQLGIGREEAGAYIRKYFERFPGIRDYMEATKAFCRTHGYVTTLFGRRAHYPDIKASNASVRAFNERAAINAPLQGSAADIIRRAMVRIEPALEQAKLSARMLLQVHDELVFEVPGDEVDTMVPIVRKLMIDAALPAVALKVPLQVDARAAANWDEAH